MPQAFKLLGVINKRTKGGIKKTKGVNLGLLWALQDSNLKL